VRMPEPCLFTWHRHPPSSSPSSTGISNGRHAAAVAQRAGSLTDARSSSAASSPIKHAVLAIRTLCRVSRLAAGGQRRAGHASGTALRGGGCGMAEHADRPAEHRPRLGGMGTGGPSRHSPRTSSLSRPSCLCGYFVTFNRESTKRTWILRNPKKLLALANCTCAAGYGGASGPLLLRSVRGRRCQVGGSKHSMRAVCSRLVCSAQCHDGVRDVSCNCSAHEFSTPGADSAEDCLCVAGFFRPADLDNNSSAYAPCALGFFRNETHAQDWGSLACLPCPEIFSTLSVAMVSADGCQQCPAGAYTSDRGELGVTCVQCGVNAQSVRADCRAYCRQDKSRIRSSQRRHTSPPDTARTGPHPPQTCKSLPHTQYTDIRPGSCSQRCSCSCSVSRLARED